MAILDLISHVHLPFSFNMLPRYLKHFIFSCCFWSIVIVIGDGCLVSNNTNMKSSNLADVEIEGLPQTMPGQLPCTTLPVRCSIYVAKHYVNTGRSWNVISSGHVWTHPQEQGVEVCRITVSNTSQLPCCLFINTTEGFRFLWPCIVSKVWREKTNKMQQLDYYY